MSLTKIVATFAFAVMLVVAFSTSNEIQAQSGSRGGGIASGVAGSGSRALPSVVTNFGGPQQSYAAPQAQYSGAPGGTQFSGGSSPVYSPAVSSGTNCGCSGAPAPISIAAPAPCGCSAPAPLPVASPCGGCGNSHFGNLRRGPATGIRGGLFQRARPCSGCN